MNALNRLWGSTLKGIDFDISHHQVRIVAHTVIGSAEETVELLLTGVREFRFFDGDPSIWDYTEITAISATKMADGSYLVDITMWTDDAGLTIRSDEFQMKELPPGVGGS